MAWQSVVNAVKRSVAGAAKRLMGPPDFSRSKPFALFQFRTANDLKQWVCTSDKKAFGGHSTAKVEVMPEGYVRFSGNLSTKLPSNADVVRSGFCLLRTQRPKPKLFGDTYIKLGTHNAIEFEIRGDGRAYIANLQPDTYREEDLHQATIYTRGGPHWQTVQIPLTEFLLTYRGYVQNEQSIINGDKIKTLGILLADARDGPFQLDIREIRAVTMVDADPRMDRTRARMKTEWAPHGTENGKDTATTTTTTTTTTTQTQTHAGANADSSDSDSTSDSAQSQRSGSGSGSEPHRG
ncbi:hypothetical protein PTSG_01955 [Salpingoeca rosetta]|uniref:NADH:ubiquinone oxidoreductase intermediate-associated protein 30 domain-containing protein n=1 Tax=Salpingoeca rosetta (strain ATCC 50818 / BSB-021) TaxID=946362 RepID=F2TZG0_SALR5|nr:uncharacterized protein PTSG_01955 [Salpingoeca rosetta]EGD78984.1 hypothetical protein PTSG_01955 [Salpingoeca rosetta]|eukprot:XP_004997940.1 hypothetical protein PTSG_01955 [Salpingoeca rosetta]